MILYSCSLQIRKTILLKWNSNIGGEMILQYKTESRLLSLLGLAQKAGYVGSGEFLTEKAVKEKTAALVLVATDASENTKKMFQNLCDYYKVPIYFFGDKEKIGHAIGKEFRASLAVKEAGMAKAIEKQLKLINT